MEIVRDKQLKLKNIIYSNYIYHLSINNNQCYIFSLKLYQNYLHIFLCHYLKFKYLVLHLELFIVIDHSIDAYYMYVMRFNNR